MRFVIFTASAVFCQPSGPPTPSHALTAPTVLVSVEMKPYDGVSLGTPMEAPLPEAFIQSLGVDMSLLVGEQIEIERSQLSSVPLLEFDVELVPGTNGSVSAFKVKGRLARSFEGTIATVTDRDDIVIKYQSNCESLNGVHPLMRDFLILKEIQDLGLSPVPMFLSPPTKFGPLITLKTVFKMPEAYRRECVASPLSAVRYMVMERVEGTVHDQIRWYQDNGQVPSLRESVKTMIQAIEGIQQIHERGIVHGDIHSGNLALIHRGGKLKVGFLDFGLAFFVTENRPEMVYPPMQLPHCLWSHWNIEGYRFGFRDDVFKILITGALMMNGAVWLRRCKALESDAAAMFEWKRRGNIFTVPNRADFMTRLLRLSPERRAEVSTHLMQALDLARSVENVDDTPPYADILAALTTVITAL